MANVDRPFGFRPCEPDAPIHHHTLSATNAVIRKGHPVVKGTDGYVVEATAGGGAISILGISAEYKAANSGGKIGVYDDPSTEFYAQEDGDSYTSTVANEGENADFIATHTSNNTVDSATEIDISSHAATATLQFRLIRLANELPNNAYGANAIWRVRVNVAQYKSETGI